MQEVSNKNIRSRSFCYTVNNYHEAHIQEVRALSRLASYAIFGKETATTGTKHLQGYIHYDNARSWQSIKKKLPTAHIEVAQGTPAQNRTYCMKEGDFEEFGTLPQQGSRTDLQSVQTALDGGLSEIQISQDHFSVWVKYNRAFDRYVQLRMVPRNSAPRVEWVWGPTGVGKSRYAFESSASVYSKNSSKWWDGYAQQQTIVIDDIEPQMWPLREVLTLLDRYPCQREIKGGTVHINSPRIVITSDGPPQAKYCHLLPNELSQLLRRITEIIELKPDVIAV